jgi:hypothetical protein
MRTGLELRGRLHALRGDGHAEAVRHGVERRVEHGEAAMGAPHGLCCASSLKIAGNRA